jgi:hypothetical protein
MVASAMLLVEAVTLARLLHDEVAAGRIDYQPASESPTKDGLSEARYVLNGGLPDDVKAALRELRPLT